MSDPQTTKTVAIVGSRDWPEDQNGKILEVVWGLPDGTKVISGGAVGVDTVAIDAAKDRGLPWDEHKPKQGGLGELFARNEAIAMEADAMIAFQYDDSNGTQHAIDCMSRRRKPHVVINEYGKLPTVFD